MMFCQLRGTPSKPTTTSTQKDSEHEANVPCHLTNPGLQQDQTLARIGARRRKLRRVRQLGKLLQVQRAIA